MAGLIISGTTVKVVSAPRETIEIGDRARAFDGSMLSTIRSRKNQWAFDTRPLVDADADTLEGLLNATPPLTCSGDLLGGTVSCHGQLVRRNPILGTSPLRFIVSFVLHEA